MSRELQCIAISDHFLLPALNDVLVSYNNADSNGRSLPFGVAFGEHHPQKYIQKQMDDVCKKIQEADDTRSKSLQAIAEEIVVSRKHSGAPVVQYVRAILKQYKLLPVNLELSLKEMKDLYSQITSIRPLEEGEFPCKLNKVVFSFHSAREQFDDQLSTLISSHSAGQEVKSSFRRKANIVLLDWFHAHQSNPYPSPKLKTRWSK
jgi:hypothetical protein